MEPEEKELDDDWWGRRALHIKNYRMDLHPANSWLNAVGYDMSTSFITQTPCIVVDQQLKGVEVFGCK